MSKEAADQKLLKMMQLKAGAAVTAAAASAPAAKAVPPKKKISFSFSMRTLNQALLVVIIGCAVGLALEMRSGLELLKQEVNFTDDVKSPRSLADIALPSVNDAKYYLEKVNARNIFRPVEAQTKGTAAVQNLAKKMSRYKLVGVAWLDLPETASAMIEDKQTKMTYFLKQGEQLEGVSLKTIYTDRVVFSYENEETTIKL